MAIEYATPPDYDEETISSSDVEDECLWKRIKFNEETDHEADNIDHAPDDII